MRCKHIDIRISHISPVTAAAICGVNLNQDGVITELSHSTLTYVLLVSLWTNWILTTNHFQIIVQTQPQKWKVRIETRIKNKKMCPCLISAPILEDARGSRLNSSTILHLDTGWWWLLKLMPLSFYPRGMSSGTHCIGGCVGPTADVEAVEKRKIS
jgi:hypothetical protein